MPAYRDFAAAMHLILECHGRVIVSGIGKSGHIGRKIAATLASTGTPAYFVHAAEAIHGDLGMITSNDVVIAISNSGGTEELLTIAAMLKREGGKLIAITGNPDSVLARDADVHLDARVAEEACPLQAGADRQHHGRPRPWRCARCRIAGCPHDFQAGGFCPLAPRRFAGAAFAHPRASDVMRADATCSFRAR